MGTKIETPESCETQLRNRKKKEKKVESQTEESPPSDEDDLKKKLRNFTNEKFVEKPDTSAFVVSNNEGGHFTLRLEFDPMSVALLIVGLLTRFYRLAEPRNVV